MGDRWRGTCIGATGSISSVDGEVVACSDGRNGDGLICGSGEPGRDEWSDPWLWVDDGDGSRESIQILSYYGFGEGRAWVASGSGDAVAGPAVL